MNASVAQLRLWRRYGGGDRRSRRRQSLGSLLTLKQPPFRPPFENWVLPMSLVTGHPLLPKGAGGLQGVAKQ